MKEASAVSVFKDGVLQSCRLQKARCASFIPLSWQLANRYRMRVRLRLNACLTAWPTEQEGETGNSPGAVTEDEITRAALTIAFAMLNPRMFVISSLNESIDIHETGYVAWDVERYADMAKNGVESKQHEKLRKYFPVSPLGKISEPTTIVDNHGKILVWYLPDIVSPERVVSLQIISNLDLINHLDKELH
jgi:hypothetical protein